uniref:Fibroblast growth factor (acidic) intracellular binding protein b n=1 Tax=Sinocyclocheilus anshuiensis TaxID=1608454 RepID=A0A671QFH1_9TELE
MEVDVFVGNTTVLDEDVYQLWLDGHTVTDALRIRMETGALQECEANAEVLHVVFLVLLICLLQYLSCRCYEFDRVFAREVLDDISSKTGIALKSCRRQVCVFKVVEELKGPLVENTQRHFLLSDCSHRFETGKRKLQYLSFQDFAFCAGQLSSYWTVGAVDNMMEDMDVNLEKEFLHDLQVLKVLVNDKDMLDQHKRHVNNLFRWSLFVIEMEANFKNLSRALVNIASKLIHTKDVRDLFIELVVKFVEPCRSDKWTIGDLRLFLMHYSSSVHTLEAFRHQVVWDRYMGVIKSCILKMYHD